jgi:hypothetical protein
VAAGVTALQDRGIRLWSLDVEAAAPRLVTCTLRLVESPVRSIVRRGCNAYRLRHSHTAAPGGKTLRLERREAGS